MRRISSLSWLVSGCLGFLVGTGVPHPSVLRAGDGPALLAQADQPGFNPLSKVTPGMTMLDVVQQVGPPSDEKAATYYYKRRGRIVFEGNGTPGDKTKVLRVEQDQMEDGIP
jgi:hypothetical protein